MKLRVERDVLADAVAWTARSLPARPAVPVLAGLLLAADAEALTVAGFDYEVSTRVRLATADPAAGTTVRDEGRVLVSGRLLADITRALPAAPVELVSEGSRLVVTCGSARFTLPTLPVEEYPSLPDMPASSGTVAAEHFAGAVASVAVAAGRDDTLPVLTGVRLEIDGARITLAATDRYRLAVCEIGWDPIDPGVTATALVPARTLADAARALVAAEPVTLALAGGAGSAPGGGGGDGMIGFESGGRRTTTRLLEGEFPKYRSLLPTDTPITAEVDTAALTEAVKRVSLVATRTTPVRLSFTADGLTLDAGTGEEAQASEALDATLTGEDLSIAFNPTYLLDGLGAVGAPVTRFAFTAPQKPAVLSAAAGGEDATGAGDARYLIMPVRLGA